MRTVQCLCFVFALIACSRGTTSPCSTDVTTCKKVCPFHNVSCVTAGGFTQYKSILNGIISELQPLDPLCINEICGETRSMQYELTHIELRGLRQCGVTSLRLNVTNEAYLHYLHCPQLSATFYLEVKISPCKGRLVKVTVDACECDICNSGQYGIFVKDIDLLPHFFVQSHRSTLNCRNKIKYEICPVDDDGTDYADEWIAQVKNELSKDLVNDTRDRLQELIYYLFTVICKKAMKIVFKGIDLYNRHFTMGEVLPGCGRQCN